MGFRKGLVWKLGEDASLRAQLSHMPFVYLTKPEAAGAAYGARLQTCGVQAERVVMQEGCLEDQKR